VPTCETEPPTRACTGVGALEMVACMTGFGSTFTSTHMYNTPSNIPHHTKCDRECYQIFLIIQSVTGSVTIHIICTVAPCYGELLTYWFILHLVAVSIALAILLALALFVAVATALATAVNALFDAVTIALAALAIALFNAVAIALATLTITLFVAIAIALVAVTIALSVHCLCPLCCRPHCPCHHQYFPLCLPLSLLLPLSPLPSLAAVTAEARTSALAAKALVTTPLAALAITRFVSRNVVANAIASSEVQSKMIIMGHQILSCHVLVVRSFFS
jgi:hypothetical protein